MQNCSGFGIYGWIASPTQWTWVWTSSRSWWWTGRSGVLWFMGSQRVGHNWTTELNWSHRYEMSNLWYNKFPCEWEKKNKNQYELLASPQNGNTSGLRWQRNMWIWKLTQKSVWKLFRNRRHLRKKCHPRIQCACLRGWQKKIIDNGKSFRALLKFWTVLLPLAIHYIFCYVHEILKW